MYVINNLGLYLKNNVLKICQANKDNNTSQNLISLMEFNQDTFQRPHKRVNFGRFEKGIIAESSNIIFKTVKAAKKFAKNHLKVQAGFAGNLKLANLVVNALNDVKKLGYALPRKIITDYERFEKDGDRVVQESRGAYKNTTAAMITPSLNGGTIFLNPKFDWEDIKERMAKGFKAKKIATDNPRGIIYHEVGHFLHYMSSPSEYNTNLIIPKNTKKLIRNELCKYGAVDCTNL